MPFCSSRCQTIDLGRWLGEQHALPIVRSDEDAEEGQDSASHDDEWRAASRDPG
jgi:endogenous inhibitor of DNA gyrase (YacG/DUF329 family)